VQRECHGAGVSRAFHSDLQPGDPASERRVGADRSGFHGGQPTSRLRRVALAADVERARQIVVVAVRRHASAARAARWPVGMAQLAADRRRVTRVRLARHGVALETFRRVDDRVRAAVLALPAILRPVARDRAVRARRGRARAVVLRAVVREAAVVGQRARLIRRALGIAAHAAGHGWWRRGRRIGHRQDARVGVEMVTRIQIALDRRIRARGNGAQPEQDRRSGEVAFPHGWDLACQQLQRALRRCSLIE